MARFAPQEKATPVLLLDGPGTVLRRAQGVAKPAQVEELCKLIPEMLPQQETKVAAQP